MLHFVVGEKNDWLGGDRQTIIDSGSACISIDVFIALRRKCEKVLGHGGEILIESTVLVGIVCEEIKIFGCVPDTDDEEKR